MNQKGITTIVIILIIIGVLVLAGGVWYWQSQKGGPKPGEITTDETANWKTYRSEKYRFEVRYPLDWIIGEENYAIPSNNEVRVVRFQSNNNTLAFTVRIKTSDPRENKKEFLLDRGFINSSFKIGARSYPVSIFPEGYECYEPATFDECSRFYLVIDDKDRWYILQGDGGLTEGIKTPYTQILSTFKLNN